MSELIAAHLAHLRAGGYSDRTIHSRKDILRRLHDALPYGLAYAATEQIEAWLGEAGWSRWTRCTYSTHIRAFFAWADVHGHLYGDPAADIVRPRPPRCVPSPVTDDQLARALHSDDPWHVAVVLAAFGGLRADEISRARSEHITADTVHIPDGKGGEPGSVPTHPFLWESIRGRSGLLVTHYGEPVTGRWISANARHHFDRMGMPDVRMHRFRHWYGTMIQRATGDIRVTQECMRHRSVTSTQGYTLVTGEARRAAVAALIVPLGAPASR
jgi:integrase